MIRRNKKLIIITSIITMLPVLAGVLLWNRLPDTIACVMVGILFLVIGNYLPKCRQNYTIGIKLPWTLDNEENWNRTHRMAGWLWIVGGVVMLISTFQQVVSQVVVILILTMIMVLVPAGYSFIIYVKQLKEK